MLGLEDDIEQSAREDWIKHLALWDLTNPVLRKKLFRIIQSASKEAFADVRRSFAETHDADIERLIDQFVKQFEPEDLLVTPLQVEA